MRSYCIAISTKIPEKSWHEGLGSFPIVAVPVPPMSKDEILECIQNDIFMNEESAKAIASIWDDFGQEPIGIAFLRQRAGSGWDANEREKLFQEDMTDFFVHTFGEEGMESVVEVEIMKLVGLLQGTLTTIEVQRIFALTNSSNDGVLQKLMDRGLIEEKNDLLYAHDAWSRGHARTSWTDRIGGHPWPLIIRYAGLGAAPVMGLVRHWAFVSPYVTDTQVCPQTTKKEEHAIGISVNMLARLENLDFLVSDLTQAFPSLGQSVTQHLAQNVLGGSRQWQGMTRFALMRIAALMRDIRNEYQEEFKDISHLLLYDHKGLEVWNALALRHRLCRRHAELVGKLIMIRINIPSLNVIEGIDRSTIDQVMMEAGDQLYEIILLSSVESVVIRRDVSSRKEAIERLIRFLDIIHQI